MLAKTARVRNAAEFDRIFRRGQSRYGRYLGVRALAPGTAFAVPQAGFIVGRRVDSRAVGRNRLKRRLRAIVRERYAALRPAGFAVIAKPSAARCSYQELDAELGELLQSLDVLEPSASPTPSTPLTPPNVAKD